ncbi:hypothetical protein [Pseudoduganella chitinolytica]|uniref:Uncharacterized protein n=1 Tax=Pseudoduganella chitinolytica TaxID=34070 RepID=A0ABY8BEV7_9BURK|nr:hypothetical protein [Pseudoduganella chitinolytica]WEF34241.1 hypothetical protein PX653_05580 [Pseudoduganella chitinolytica]
MGNLTKLDDTRVQEFIRWSQASAKYLLWQDGDSAPSVVKVNRVAWGFLMETIRGDTRHRYDYDFDAAAAEHYMYIRFLAGNSGDPTCHTAPTLYALKKVFYQLLGRLQEDQAQGGHPVLPSNPYIVAWGQKGVMDGLADYKSLSKGADYQVGAAMGALARFVVSPSMADKIAGYAIKSGKALPAYMK